MGRQTVIRTDTSAGGTACTCRSGGMCNSSDSCRERGEQRWRQCEYGASYSGIPCIRGTFYIFTVIRSKIPSWERAPGYHRREFRVCADYDGDCGAGEGCGHDFRSHAHRGCCGDYCGIAIKQIRKVFPPLVIGTVIFAIGLSLYTTAINYMAGNSSNTYELVVEQQGKTEALVYGSWQNWLVAFVTLGIVVALNHYGKGLFKLASILIGLICGYLLALCFGMVDFSALSSAGWVQIPTPLAFGIRFDISAIIPLAILFLVNSIQAMGDFSATTSGGMDRLPTDSELNGGIIGYGVSNMFSALFGCPPTATYSQNVGIVGSTRVVARRVFSMAATVLLIAGLIPKFSALLRTIPQCVLGGAVASVFASIAMTGIKLLTTEKLTFRNTTVAGLSIAIGMGVSLSDGCLNQMTQSIHSALNMSMSLESFQSIINNTFASSPVVLATIFAVILNLVLPKDKPEENA